MDTSHPDQEISALIAELGNPDGLARQRARLALTRSGQAAIPALLAALNSPDGATRLEAVRVLSELRDPATAAALTDTLLDDETGVRWAAMEALIHMDRACLRPLLEKFVKNFESVWLREGVHHVLHVLKDRALLKQPEIALYEKMNALESISLEPPLVGVAWAAEKALEALDHG